MERIFLSPPDLGGEEFLQVHDAIKSNYIAPFGPKISEFEECFKTYTGIKHALAVNSGTAAMHLALNSVSIKKRDIVLASSLTFIGSVAPVKYLGAELAFIDSKADTWNIDPSLVIEAIKYFDNLNLKVKALIPTDIYGECCEYDQLQEISNYYDISLIIDCAESLGSKYKSRSSGTAGKASIFSFNGNKIITTSGGGILASNDKLVIDRARYLSQQAKSQVPYYHHEELGYNYSLSNISAAIGVGQFKYLNKKVTKKRLINKWYKQNLADIESIFFMPEASYGKSNKWLTVICMKDDSKKPEKLRQHLENYNIESRRVWKPMHMQPVFEDCLFFGNNVSDYLFEHGLCLPSGTNLTKDNVNMICDRIRSFIKH